MKNIQQIRKDFPFITAHPHYIYADSAATSLKPNAVLASITNFYRNHTANIHRSTHLMAEEATIAFEQARKKVSAFINADANEIIFTANATHGFNLLAQMLKLHEKDLIIGSAMDHHSNYLPWLSRCRYVHLPLSADGTFQLSHLPEHIGKEAKLLLINHVSNVTGKIQNLKAICRWAKQHDLLTVVDGSQSVGHLPIDVKDLEMDFLIFSAHKMMGPSGVGVLFGRFDQLLQLDPAQQGGGVVQKVTSEEIFLKPIPHRFEAGTPNIENVIGFGAAIDYLEAVGMDRIQQHGEQLVDHFLNRAQELNPFRLIHQAADRVPIFSLVPQDNRLDVHTLARTLSDRYNILSTAGKQCAHPFYLYKNIPSGSVRFSFSVYNTFEEVDHILGALEELGAFSRVPNTLFSKAS